MTTALNLLHFFLLTFPSPGGVLNHTHSPLTSTETSIWLPIMQSKTRTWTSSLWKLHQMIVTWEEMTSSAGRGGGRVRVRGRGFWTSSRRGCAGGGRKRWGGECVRRWRGGEGERGFNTTQFLTLSSPGQPPSSLLPGLNYAIGNDASFCLLSCNRVRSR